MASESDKPHSAFDHNHYVPCLRWKLGEYQAVLRLKAATKTRITPLIEVPEIGWDFETGSEMKSVDEHLAPFAKRVEKKWGSRPCFVDLKLLAPNVLMKSGTHPVQFVFEKLRIRGCRAIPVCGPERDQEYQRAVQNAVAETGLGFCLRLGLQDAAMGNAGQTLEQLLHTMKVRKSDTHFILDLNAPENFVPIDGFAKLVQSVLERLPRADAWRTFTIMGTAFPSTMGKIKRGAQLIDRYEWLLYVKMRDHFSRAGQRLPTFGDYGIAHPEVLFLDMRMVKPAASIRYTVDDAWYILKGQSVRARDRDGFAQYRDLCGMVTASGHFMGRNFSWGDAYVEDCAGGVGSTGNLTSWRCVGTNHHIEKVVRDIASLHG